MLTKAFRMMCVAAVLAVFVSIPGCTARSITITSNPPGADVMVNRRFIGQTPVRVGFTHYGVYLVEIRKEKFETLSKEECISPPLYSYEPVSLVSDNLIPARLNDDIYLHYVLKPEGEVTERKGLLERMEAARQGQLTLGDRHISVPYSVPPKTPEQVAKDVQKKADATAPQLGPDGKPLPPVGPKPNEFIIKPIETEVPKGPTIGKELNIKPTTPAIKPDAPKPLEPKKDQPPPRTPKNEEIQFEKPPAPKTDAPKTDAPKTEPAK
jgi:hypothetical protein